MDRLKEILDQNNQLDNMEPEEGHFERFESKLNHRFQKKPAYNIQRILKVAAITVLLAMSGLWINDQLGSEAAPAQALRLSDVSSEYAEVEMFFAGNLETKINELNQLSEQDVELREMIEESELASLDSVYRQLQEELATNPDDERIIDAMIQHYETKMTIINKILNELKRIKYLKSKHHEQVEM
jgi:hypothetical protein